MSKPGRTLSVPPTINYSELAEKFIAFKAAHESMKDSLNILFKDLNSRNLLTKGSKFLEAKNAYIRDGYLTTTMISELSHNLISTKKDERGNLNAVFQLINKALIRETDRMAKAIDYQKELDTNKVSIPQLMANKNILKKKPKEYFLELKEGNSIAKNIVQAIKREQAKSDSVSKSAESPSGPNTGSKKRRDLQPIPVVQSPPATTSGKSDSSDKPPQLIKSEDLAGRDSAYSESYMPIGKDGQNNDFNGYMAIGLNDYLAGEGDDIGYVEVGEGVSPVSDPTGAGGRPTTPIIGALEDVLNSISRTPFAGGDAGGGFSVNDVPPKYSAAGVTTVPTSPARSSPNQVAAPGLSTATPATPESTNTAPRLVKPRKVLPATPTVTVASPTYVRPSITSESVSPETSFMQFGADDTPLGTPRTLESIASESVTPATYNGGHGAGYIGQADGISPFGATSSFEPETPPPSRTDVGPQVIYDSTKSVLAGEGAATDGVGYLGQSDGVPSGTTAESAESNAAADIYAVSGKAKISANKQIQALFAELDPNDDIINAARGLKNFTYKVKDKDEQYSVTSEGKTEIVLTSSGKKITISRESNEAGNYITATEGFADDSTVPFQIANGFCTSVLNHALPNRKYSTQLVNQVLGGLGAEAGSGPASSVPGTPSTTTEGGAMSGTPPLPPRREGDSPKRSPEVEVTPKSTGKKGWLLSRINLWGKKKKGVAEVVGTVDPDSGQPPESLAGNSKSISSFDGEFNPYATIGDIIAGDGVPAFGDGVGAITPNDTYGSDTSVDAALGGGATTTETTVDSAFSTATTGPGARHSAVGNVVSIDDFNRQATKNLKDLFGSFAQSDDPSAVYASPQDSLMATLAADMLGEGIPLGGAKYSVEQDLTTKAITLTSGVKSIVISQAQGQEMVIVPNGFEERSGEPYEVVNAFCARAKGIPIPNPVSRITDDGLYDQPQGSIPKVVTTLKSKDVYGATGAGVITSSTDLAPEGATVEGTSTESTVYDTYGTTGTVVKPPVTPTTSEDDLRNKDGDGYVAIGDEVPPNGINQTNNPYAVFQDVNSQSDISPYAMGNGNDKTSPETAELTTSISSNDHLGKYIKAANDAEKDATSVKKEPEAKKKGLGRFFGRQKNKAIKPKRTQVAPSNATIQDSSSNDEAVKNHLVPWVYAAIQGLPGNIDLTTVEGITNVKGLLAQKAIDDTGGVENVEGSDPTRSRDSEEGAKKQVNYKGNLPANIMQDLGNALTKTFIIEGRTPLNSDQIKKVAKLRTELTKAITSDSDKDGKTEAGNLLQKLQEYYGNGKEEKVKALSHYTSIISQVCGDNITKQGVLMALVNDPALSSSAGLSTPSFPQLSVAAQRSDSLKGPAMGQDGYLKSVTNLEGQDSSPESNIGSTPSIDNPGNVGYMKVGSDNSSATSSPRNSITGSGSEDGESVIAGNEGDVNGSNDDGNGGSDNGGGDNNGGYLEVKPAEQSLTIAQMDQQYQEFFGNRVGVNDENLYDLATSASVKPNPVSSPSPSTENKTLFEILSSIAINKNTLGSTQADQNIDVDGQGQPESQQESPNSPAQTPIQPIYYFAKKKSQSLRSPFLTPQSDQGSDHDDSIMTQYDNVSFMGNIGFGNDDTANNGENQNEGAPPQYGLYEIPIPVVDTAINKIVEGTGDQFFNAKILFASLGAAVAAGGDVAKVKSDLIVKVNEAITKLNDQNQNGLKLLQAALQDLGGETSVDSTTPDFPIVFPAKIENSAIGKVAISSRGRMATPFLTPARGGAVSVTPYENTPFGAQLGRSRLNLVFTPSREYFEKINRRDGPPIPMPPLTDGDLSGQSDHKESKTTVSKKEAKELLDLLTQERKSNAFGQTTVASGLFASKEVARKLGIEVGADLTVDERGVDANSVITSTDASSQTTSLTKDDDGQNSADKTETIKLAYHAFYKLKEALDELSKEPSVDTEADVDSMTADMARIFPITSTDDVAGGGKLFMQELQEALSKRNGGNDISKDQSKVKTPEKEVQKSYSELIKSISEVEGWKKALETDEKANSRKKGLVINAVIGDASFGPVLTDEFFADMVMTAEVFLKDKIKKLPDLKKVNEGNGEKKGGGSKVGIDTTVANNAFGMGAGNLGGDGGKDKKNEKGKGGEGNGAKDEDSEGDKPKKKGWNWLRGTTKKAVKKVKTERGKSNSVKGEDVHGVGVKSSVGRTVENPDFGPDPTSVHGTGVLGSTVASSGVESGSASTVTGLDSDAVLAPTTPSTKTDHRLKPVYDYINLDRPKRDTKIPNEHEETVGNFVRAVQKNQSETKPTTPYRGIGAKLDVMQYEAEEGQEGEKFLQIGEIFSPEDGRFKKDWQNFSADEMMGAKITSLTNMQGEVLDSGAIAQLLKTTEGQKEIASILHSEAEIKFTIKKYGVSHNITCDNRVNKTAIFAPTEESKPDNTKFSALSSQIDYANIAKIEDPVNKMIEECITRGKTPATISRSNRVESLDKIVRLGTSASV